MKIHQLNLGSVLSKEAQKKIKGGTPICDTGTYIKCVCNNGDTICAFGNGTQTTATICVNDDACANYGGLKSANGCYTSCGA